LVAELHDITATDKQVVVLALGSEQRDDRRLERANLTALLIAVKRREIIRFSQKERYMAHDDDQDASKGAPEGIDRRQDPIVEDLRPDPAQPPEVRRRMSGFLGDSDRTGFRRLYFTRDLDYYAEFRVEDVVQMASIPVEAPPFVGEEATRVTLRRDATVEYTRTRTARPLDIFDLDVQLGRAAALSAQLVRGPIESITCWGTCAVGFTCEASCCPPPE
jgi:hypothetical protein